MKTQFLDCKFLPSPSLKLVILPCLSVVDWHHFNAVATLLDPQTHRHIRIMHGNPRMCLTCHCSAWTSGSLNHKPPIHWPQSKHVRKALKRIRKAGVNYDVRAAKRQVHACVGHRVVGNSHVYMLMVVDLCSLSLLAQSGRCLERYGPVSP